jgi:hypothetical protein
MKSVIKVSVKSCFADKRGIYIARRKTKARCAVA